jgi:hypothetical protein
LYAIAEIVQHVFAKKLSTAQIFFRAAHFSARDETQLRAAKSIFTRSRATSID